MQALGNGSKKLHNLLFSLFILVMAALCLCLSPMAMAVPAGSLIQNVATIEYSAVTESRNIVESNSAEFVVDRRISVIVTALDADEVSVFPGMNQAVLAYQILNDSNAMLDFVLTAQAVQDAQSPQSALLPASSYQVVVDNGNGVFEPEVDVLNYLDDVPAGESRVAFIIAQVPLESQVGEQLLLSLNARAAEAGIPQEDGEAPATDSKEPISPYSLSTQVALSAQAEAESESATTAGVLGELIQVDDAGRAAPDAQPIDAKSKPDFLNEMLDIFADPAGLTALALATDGAQDSAYNGQHAAASAMVVEASPLFLNKSAVVLNEEGNASPYAGAILRYQIEVNALATIADIVITDVIPEGARYVGGTLMLDGAALSDQDDADAGAKLADAIQVELGQMVKDQQRYIQFDVRVE